MTEKPGIGSIWSCAALGSGMAGTAVGILTFGWMLAYSDGSSGNPLDALSAGLSMVFVGAVIGAIIGAPIGFAVGLVVSRSLGTSIGHAALAGALTGASYPLFFLMAEPPADGSSPLALIGPVVGFYGLGAICGALAHRIVIGRPAPQ